MTFKKHQFSLFYFHQWWTWNVSLGNADESAWRIQAMMKKLRRCVSPAPKGKSWFLYLGKYFILNYMAFQFTIFTFYFQSWRHPLSAFLRSHKSPLPPRKVSSPLKRARRLHLRTSTHNQILSLQISTQEWNFPVSAGALVRYNVFFLGDHRIHDFCPAISFSLDGRVTDDDDLMAQFLDFPSPTEEDLNQLEKEVLDQVWWSSISNDNKICILMASVFKCQMSHLNFTFRPMSSVSTLHQNRMGRTLLYSTFKPTSSIWTRHQNRRSPKELR